VVLFQQRLFGAAIARALSDSHQLKLVTLSLRTLSAQALEAIHPDAIIVEGPMTGDVKARLLDVSPVLTFIIGPESNVAEVYQKHEMIPATADDIIARIVHKTR
jgi:hypothetical protein